MPNKLLRKISILIILIILAGSPFLAKAGVFINEIMYDVEGSDDKKEWVEIYNDSASEINLKDWRFNDGSNHVLNEPPANGGRGSLVLPALSYAILVSDATTTIVSYPSYSGIVIDTAMSLGNTSETVKIIDANGTLIDSVSYNSSMGANGDGKTLQKISGSWVAAVPTFGAQNIGAISSHSAGLSSQSSAQSSSVSQNIASGSVDYHYKNEQISAKAGENKTAVAGADIVLEGNALGFKKEPLENGRYLWNLGDGSYKEGKNIRHVYKYPGNYIAVLNVSSGDASASDRINIKVIPNELQIIDAQNEFIKLKNKSGIVLDISGWFLRAGSATGGTVFKFPDYSLVAANSELVISSDISGLKFADNKFTAEMLYPNGSVAFSYSPYLASSLSSKPKEIILSKPLEKKAEIALPIIPQKNYSTPSSNSSAPSAEKNQPAGKTGLASVITIGEKNNNGNKIWLILATITGIIGGAGIFLARKFTYTEK